MARDENRSLGIGGPAYGVCQLRYGHRVLGADVVGPTGPPANQNRPKPNRQVGGVHVAAKRSAIPGDADGMPGQDVPDEVAHREVRVKRQVRSHEGKTPRDRNLKPLRPKAEFLGHSLALRV